MSPRFGLLIGVFALFLAAPAGAATYVVSNTNDSGAGSLRAAITSANGGDADTITFSVNGTIGVGAAMEISDADTTITGNGSALTILDGGGTDRILTVTGGPVTISGVRLINGKASSANNEGGSAIAVAGGVTLNLTSAVVANNVISDGGSGFGGALRGLGGAVLNVTDSTFSNNSVDVASTTDGANGGAIAAYEATLNLLRSTISGNSSTDLNGGGGGLYISGDALITNSTITGNHAGDGDMGGGGGGIRAEGGGRTWRSLNSTIAGNDTTASGFGGGGILMADSPMIIQNSIVSGNLQLPGTVSNCEIVSSSSVDNDLGNLENGSTCTFGAVSNPLLGSLANNGGSTFTIALQSGSAAINAAPTGCPATDQRGIARTATGCDSGAFEAAPASVATGSASGVGVTSATLAGTASNPGFAGTYRFEYGTTTSYGSSTTAQALAAGASGVDASAALTGLSPGSTYYYRLVATTPDGTVAGADQTFITATGTGTGGGGGGTDTGTGGGGGGTGTGGGGGTGTGTPVVFGLSDKPKAAINSVVVKVNCPGPGTLTGTLALAGKARAAAAKPLGKATKKVLKAGRVTLTIKLTKAAKRLLAKKRKLVVRVKVTFKPTAGGPATTKTTTVTLRAKKKKP